MYFVVVIFGLFINIIVFLGVREAVIFWDNNGVNVIMYILLYK